jgi:uncharacterized protein (TIGR02284 family)
MAVFLGEVDREALAAAVRHIGVLDQLIVACEDASRAFRTGAELLDDRALQASFESYANQHAAYSKQLQAVVLFLGGHPSGRGSSEGALRRAKMTLRAVLANSDPATVRRCREAERAVAIVYLWALGRGLPSDVATLVGRQYEEVRKVAHRLDALGAADAARRDLAG